MKSMGKPQLLSLVRPEEADLYSPNWRKMQVKQELNDVGEKQEVQIDELTGLILEKKIGSGSFGEVFLGKLDGTPCACKKVSNTRDLEREAKTLKQLTHPNIVLFIGFGVTDDGSKYMLFEYVSGGSLLTYIQQNQNKLSPKDLLSMAIGAARGMVYLERKHIVHRDLAIRNLLVDHQHQVKVSDFGLSRDTQYLGSDSQIPIRWAAPEVFKQAPLSSKSDVYSFGIVLWELFEFGILPYAQYSNNQVVQLKTGSEGIANLPKPGICPDRVYSLMERCWKYNMDERSTFKEVLDELEDILGAVSTEPMIQLKPKNVAPLTSKENYN